MNTDEWYVLYSRELEERWITKRDYWFPSVRNWVNVCVMTE